MSFLVEKTTGDFLNQSLFIFWGGAEQSKNEAIMENDELVLYGNPTPSDIEFLHSNPFSFPSISSSSTLSSTRSDAQSAPPELERVFDRICDEYAEWVVRAGKQFPPEWSMPDLVRTVIGDEAIHIPGFLPPVPVLDPV
uniref:hypothetical protein n=1 Tax=Jatropha curcas TaxID=180498 RepID=UPI0027A09D06|nr:hypothetical protein QLP06_mgp098 [Jatropha curcas]WFG81141.1 hypothetical protein [Jatropha curcas]